MSNTVIVCRFVLPRKKKARRKGNTITLEVDGLRAVISNGAAGRTLTLDDVTFFLQVLWTKARIACASGKTLKQFVKGE